MKDGFHVLEFGAVAMVIDLFSELSLAVMLLRVIYVALLFGKTWSAYFLAVLTGRSDTARSSTGPLDDTSLAGRGDSLHVLPKTPRENIR